MNNQMDNGLNTMNSSEDVSQNINLNSEQGGISNSQDSINSNLTNQANGMESNIMNQTVKEALLKDSNQAPTEVGQVSREKTEIVRKEKSNWPFIIALFVGIGCFVVLLPFLIKIFGY